MKKYTITLEEYELMCEKLHSLENENSKLKGYIEGLEKQLMLGGVSKRFSINEKVIWGGMYYWVLEINDEAKKVLLANDRNQDNPQYNDWWVNIDEVNAC